jgi:[acyl-carrier-protein] S-malonyltransferase
MSLNEQLGSTYALVFPGQGSQVVGMGKDLADASPAARDVLTQADAVLGFPLSQLCFEGPAEELEDTYNAQPAILTVSIAALRALEVRAADAGETLAPAMIAGHSLGEFTAMVVADVLDFEDALRLVRERGRLMKEAGTARPGGMAAVLGLDDDQLVEVCRQAESEGIINVANANCPGQTVISGEIAPLERAMELAREAGAKRVARLPVSIASHSPLMAEVSRQLNEILDGLDLREPKMPIVGNTTAKAIATIDGLREELRHHVERPVNWTGSVREMAENGVTTFVELGAGSVLAGLNRRIDRNAKTVNIKDLGVLSA